MRAQAVVAVDGPNTMVSVRKLYGQPAQLDYRVLREALHQDACTRLGTADFDYKTAAFLQVSARTRCDELSRPGGFAAFERVLQRFGWQVWKKTAVDSPAELVDLYARLDDALTTFGYRAVGRINLALRELAVARGDRCECLQVDAKQDLRDASRDLVKVYGSHYNFATRLMLRLLLPILVACANFSWAHQMLERILVKAWLNISTAERGQVEYVQRVREALVAVLTSSLEWPDKPADLDVASLSDRELLSLAHKVRAELRSERNQLHRAGDVDDILSDWVRQQIKPDVAQAAELPAVVYLVGNDYKNHLVLAERMKRYGAEVVLVLLERHLARANPATIAQVQSYPTIRLENFVEGCCGGSAAA